jgi:hypothetical protein
MVVVRAIVDYGIGNVQDEKSMTISLCMGHERRRGETNKPFCNAPDASYEEYTSKTIRSAEELTDGVETAVEKAKEAGDVAEAGAGAGAAVVVDVLADFVVLNKSRARREPCSNGCRAASGDECPIAVNCTALRGRIGFCGGGEDEGEGERKGRGRTIRGRYWRGDLERSGGVQRRRGEPDRIPVERARSWPHWPLGRRQKTDSHPGIVFEIDVCSSTGVVCCDGDVASVWPHQARCRVSTL